MSKLFEALERVEHGGRPPEDDARAPAQTAPRRRPLVRVAPEAVPGDPAEYERLKVALGLAVRETGANTVLLVASQRGEGVSTVAVALALSMAAAARRGVLVVEADRRGPAPAAWRDPAPAPGLPELMAGAAGPDEAVLASSVPRLFFLERGAGRLDLSHAHTQARWGQLLGELARAFDWVVVDGGSFEASPDTALMAASVGAVVLVAEAERTPVALVQQTAARLQAAGARLAGVVLNRRRRHVPRFVARRL